ncbi:unnamed protein product [Schistosoma intercalatum]|nr:unnamed protein product [Schistosoma intercalatum]
MKPPNLIDKIAFKVPRLLESSLTGIVDEGSRLPHGTDGRQGTTIEASKQNASTADVSAKMPRNAVITA